MTPSRYRKQGAGETIHYAVAGTKIGRMLLAATKRGVCSIQFGDAEAELESRLSMEFPKAEIIRSDRKLGEYVKTLRAIIQGEAAKPLPLDIHATAFQRRVWEELQAIPRGATNRIAKSPRTSDIPKRLARWLARAPQIQWRLRFHAIEWCEKVARWAGIAGAWNGRKNCWRWKAPQVAPTNISRFPGSK
jgi:hypothetical protein